MIELIIANIVSWITQPANIMVLIGWGASIAKVIDSAFKEKSKDKVLKIAIEEVERMLHSQCEDKNIKKPMVVDLISKNLSPMTKRYVKTEDLEDIVEIAYRNFVLGGRVKKK